MTKLKNEVLTFKEIRKEFAKMPPKKFIWSGIKENSFGLVFGPSKSGKTIFCENLALNFAIGASEFFGYPLDGVPKKVLFIGLEEYWENRVERNESQFNSLTEIQKQLYENNFLYQPIDYLKMVITSEDWKKLKNTIKASEANIVIIDSITRMNHGNLEDSKVAQEIMQKLRDICYDLKITLICIHHTPKMYEKKLTMDSIKGSSVFSQEADFAIGINSIQKNSIRYQKEIFFRYLNCKEDLVNTFKINNNSCVELLGERDEDELLNGKDGRRDELKIKYILDYFKENTCKKHKTADLVKHFSNKLGIQERQIKNYLKKLLNEGKLKNSKKGFYYSSDCTDLNELNDEKDE